MSITGEWAPWSQKVPQIEVETHKVAAPDVVVPTLDTVRHEALLYTWLAEHKPLGKYNDFDVYKIKSIDFRHRFHPNTLLQILLSSNVKMSNIKLLKIY